MPSQFGNGCLVGSQQPARTPAPAAKSPLSETEKKTQNKVASDLFSGRERAPASWGGVFEAAWTILERWAECGIPVGAPELT